VSEGNSEHFQLIENLRILVVCVGVMWL